MNFKIRFIYLFLQILCGSCYVLLLFLSLSFFSFAFKLNELINLEFLKEKT